MHLRDLFPLDELDKAIADGMVTRRAHSKYPLFILNYTPLAQYTPGSWNQVTTQCRGLVHDADGNVLARPWPKFFNWNEPSAPVLDPTAPIVAIDKLDGSLGILVEWQGVYLMATRGSFESEQATRAHFMWPTYDERMKGWPPKGYTLLFEIIYPENRIVVQYDFTGLVLLGAVHVETGATLLPNDPLLAAWPGRRAEIFPYRTAAEAIASPPRSNAEGFVFYLPELNQRVKYKYPAYVELHRIVTGLNKLTVWEWLRDNNDLQDLIKDLPEEFVPWVEQVADELQDAAAERAHRVAALFADHDIAVQTIDDAKARKKAFALRLTGLTWERPALFSLYDGQIGRAQDYVWSLVRPTEQATPTRITE